MIDWVPDLLVLLGLVLWGVAALFAGGTVALLVYAGVIFVLFGAAIAWKRSA